MKRSEVRALQQFLKDNDHTVTGPNLGKLVNRMRAYTDYYIDDFERLTNSVSDCGTKVYEFWASYNASMTSWHFKEHSSTETRTVKTFAEAWEKASKGKTVFIDPTGTHKFSVKDFKIIETVLSNSTSASTKLHMPKKNKDWKTSNYNDRREQQELAKYGCTTKRSGK